MPGLIILILGRVEARTAKLHLPKVCSASWIFGRFASNNHREEVSKLLCPFTRALFPLTLLCVCTTLSGDGGERRINKISARPQEAR